MDEHASTQPAEWVHPTYVWWPWRTLAVALPLLASLTAAVIQGSGARMAGQGLDPEQSAALAWLTIYTAGNALILGMSSGHLGKTLFAMLGGAFVSYLAVACFDAYAVLLGHVFTLPVIFACLDRDGTLRTRITAVGIGVEAFLDGLKIALPVGLVACGLCYPIGNAWPVTRQILIFTVVTFFFVFENDLFLKSLFGFVQRGENLLPPELPPPPPEPKPETMSELLKAKRGVYEGPPEPSAAKAADQAFSEST